MNAYTLLVTEGRHIFSVCPDPDCGQVHRLSDLQLSRRGKYVKDWLDRLEQRRVNLEQKLQDLQDRERELKAKAKAVAEAEELPKIMQRLAPGLFHENIIDPREVRTLAHPVEFVVFKGMQSPDGVQEIELVHLGRNPMTRSVETAIHDGHLSWDTIKLDPTGHITSSKNRKPRINLLSLTGDEPVRPTRPAVVDVTAATDDDLRQLLASTAGSQYKLVLAEFQRRKAGKRASKQAPL